jgi:CheY-like chemotaxis protein
MADKKPVLIVSTDPEYGSRLSIQMIMRLGCQAFTAINAEDAMTKATERVYLMIVIMNDHPLDGIQLCRDLRSIPDVVNTPLLVLQSASASEHARSVSQHEAMIHGGADHYLEVPCSEEDLMNALQSLRVA